MALLYLLLWLPFGISSLAWLIYLLCVLTVDDEYQLFTFLLRFKVTDRVGLRLGLRLRLGRT